MAEYGGDGDRLSIDIARSRHCASGCRCSDNIAYLIVLIHDIYMEKIYKMDDDAGASLDHHHLDDLQLEKASYTLHMHVCISHILTQY